MSVAAAPPAAPPPPAPMVFKTIGYVEKAGGQLEAMVLEENQVQVVHIGDLMARRYLVTKVSPDSVEAIDETLAQIPMAEPSGQKPAELAASNAQQPAVPPVAAAPVEPEVLPVAARSIFRANIEGAESDSAAPAEVAQAQPATPPNTERENRVASPTEPELAANSLGYVQQADGKVEAIVADGDSVRLVPETPAVTMAQVTPPSNSQNGLSPAHISAALAAGVSSAGGAMPDRPSGSERLFDPLPIQPATYRATSHLSSADAEQSASGAFGAGSVGGAGGAMETAHAPATTNVTATPAGSTDGLTKLPVEMRPLGFVVKADGELAAILSQDDEIYIVQQGDRFAGHYRAVSVSADAVEAVEEPPRQALPSPFASPPAFPDLLSASVQQEPSFFSNEDCLGCESGELGEVLARIPDDFRAFVVYPQSYHREDGQIRDTSSRRGGRKSASPSKKAATLPDPATFIFQTLGYVETHDGEMQAIVADGSQVYLVRQGETFAGQYLATSVGAILVLAVRVSSEQDGENFRSAQTESGGKPASKKLYGYLHYPLFGWANAQDLHQVDASGSPVLTDLGVNLFNSSSTGLEPESHFFMADNPKVWF